MRIDALELVRYGHFADRRLDFRKSGSADLHLVFGPNEAGKSTIREGIGDILFKVPLRSKMTFATGTALRIGGRFTTEHGAFLVYRLKKNKDDLVDAEDVPVRGNPFATVTDGFAREIFDQTFSVDREQLEKGGDQILEGKGDLGQLLFAGSTGLQGLPERLAALDNEASQLWKPRGETKIRLLIDQIKNIDDRIDDLKTTQRDYDDAVRGATHCQTAYDEINARLGIRNKSIAQSDLWLRAFPPYREWLRAQAALDSLGPGESAVPEDLERVQHALQQVARLESGLNAAKAARQTLVDQLEGLPPADPIATHTLIIEDLRNRAIEARKERADRPNREQEAAEARATIERIVRELGLAPELASRELTVAARTTARLSELLTENAQLRSAQTRALAEVTRAEAAVSEAEDALNGLGPMVDQNNLKAVVRAAEQDNPSAEQRRISGEKARILQERKIILDAHAVTEDEETTFLSVSVPADSEIERLGLSLRAAEGALAEVSADLRACRQTVEALDLALAALTGAHAISDDVLQAAKTGRDAAVAGLTWPIDEAGLSERRRELSEWIGRTDRIYDQRIDQADALSDLRIKTANRGQEAVRLKHLETVRLEAAEAVSAAQDAIRQAAPGGFGFRDIAHIRTFVADQQKVRQLHADLMAYESQLKLIEDQRSHSDEALRQALSALGYGIDATLSGTALRSFAQDRVAEREERNMQRKAAQSAVLAAKRDLERRRADFTSNANSCEETRRQLGCALGETWIDRETDPETVREILNRLPDLLKAQTELQTATRRLAAMDENHSNGLKVLGQLQSLIDPTGSADSGADDFVPETELLVERLNRALRQADTQAGLRTRCEAEETAIENAQAGLATAHANIADLQQKFETTSVHDLRHAIQKGIARGAARSETARHEGDLLTVLKLADLNEAVSIMADLDDAALSARKDALLVERNAIDEEREEVWRELTLARKTLENISGSDDIARLIQDRESLKSELADLVRDYTRHRAGEKLLNWALTRFRQTNKAPMLASAGRFFARMTRDEYTDLITQPGDKGDILAARQRDGTLKTVDGLSEGTRHQLFLALRMAGYLELSKGRDVPPLILDDILSSSDNERAAAMLEALAGLAEAAQVIVLTHHAHVLDIANDVLSGRFALHRLTEAVR